MDGGKGIHMNLVKTSTRILIMVIFTVMLIGVVIAIRTTNMIEGNITTDYPVVYHDDLDRLLGKDWTVLGREEGYTSTLPGHTNISTWEIGYRDIEGQDRSVLISNYEDRSMTNPLGYCIEKNFQNMAAEKYARDVISPIIPAICSEDEYWIRRFNYYVSGDHITDRALEPRVEEGELIADVRLTTYPSLLESESSKDWENPESKLTLYDIDYGGIFREKPKYWFLNIYLELSRTGMSEDEYAEKAKALDKKVEQILDALNEYTDHTVNVEFIFPSGSGEEESEYYHYYVIDGAIVEKKASDMMSLQRRFTAPMYYKLRDFYENRIED